VIINNDYLGFKPFYGTANGAKTLLQIKPDIIADDDYRELHNLPRRLII
jgi:hypothetical protein